MKVCVDKEKCIGCGICANICPDVFEINADGIAVVKSDVALENKKDEVKDTAQSCPVEAIEVEDD
ncbi:MAG TPA: ferredoxin [Clostridia bacterium]